MQWGPLTSSLSLLLPCAQVASSLTHECESNFSSGARGSKCSSAQHSPLLPLNVQQPASSPPRANSHKSVGWEDGRTGGLHIFFIWVDPRSPLDNTLQEWPLPVKYADTVSQWRERYSGADVQVCPCHSLRTFVRIYPQANLCFCSKFGWCPSIANEKNVSPFILK